MHRPRRTAPPARLFFGIITGFEDLLDRTRELIERRFGDLEPLDESPMFLFPPTRTYGKTMGPGPLRRKFCFRRDPWPQDGLAAVKRGTIEIEEEVQRSRAFPVARAVNIDPGLLNDCRVILASTKDHAHRLYRGDGIWEEISLIYRGGRFETLPWTYPDFRNPDFAAYFAPIRERYLASLRAAGIVPGPAGLAAPLTPESGPPRGPAPSPPPPP